MVIGDILMLKGVRVVGNWLRMGKNDESDLCLGTDSEPVRGTRTGARRRSPYGSDG